MSSTDGDQGRKSAAGPRTIAIIGPYQSGKTTLLEALLARCGAIQRPGSVTDATSAGDASAEARAHRMSVEANIASVDYLGESYTFVDCPGSVEFAADRDAVLQLCDAAIVVCEADSRKIPALQVILHQLEELKIPRFLFLNKIDVSPARVRETLKLLQPASRTPLLLRQIPIWKDSIAVGFIDLALERAFIYRENAASDVVAMPAEDTAREKEARFSMLEKLADYDDALMEHLIEEMEPPRDKVFADLAQELRDGHVMPVLIGAALRGNGVTRLLKALRHEAPGLAETQARLGIQAAGEPLAQVFKTIHTAHGGKLSVARVLRGGFSDGATVTHPGGEERVAGISRLAGGAIAKLQKAAEGETVAFGRLEKLATGQPLTTGRNPAAAVGARAPLQTVMSRIVSPVERKDDVRLSTALHKLTDEDPSLILESDPASGEMTLRGQGEMHLRVAEERIAKRFGIAVTTRHAGISYKETIRQPSGARGRHRKQSGGHGQYGDCVLEIRPLPRGGGFVFVNKITGGAVPRQYIPSVEDGVREYLKSGPLGFPAVDIEVTLTDGSYHSVDSSDMAFMLAARAGMIEAMAAAGSVLLEPVMHVDVTVPADAMARATALVTGRRGQILGFDGKPGWEGWDIISALIPEAEIGDLVIELRSATAGVGSFTQRFDHLAELNGRSAAEVVEARKHAA